MQCHSLQVAISKPEAGRQLALVSDRLLSLLEHGWLVLLCVARLSMGMYVGIEMAPRIREKLSDLGLLWMVTKKRSK